MRKVAILVLVLLSYVLKAQDEITIPETMKFADMELKLSDGLRKKLGEEVKALTQNKKYLQIKMDRADFYFPIIDRVFDEEGFFHDFKYLCLQESSLISDAVSTSNAVGFWQFKKETAQEVGLTVNGEIDERKHISASTRGAIKYIKRNNFFFNNWIYAVMAYNTGVGGAKNLVDEKYFGEKKMNLGNDTHWYVIKFLAHKIAFENLLGKNHNPALYAVEYLPDGDKTLSAVADKTNVDIALLKEYNKWLSASRIPDEKPVTVIVPAKAEEREKVIASLGKNVITTGTKQPYYTLTTDPKDTPPAVKGNTNTATNTSTPVKNTPKEKGAYGTYYQHSIFKWNGIKSIMAKKDDTPSILANEAGISLNQFLKYNDMKSFDPIVAGKSYYLKKKKSKARLSYHTVKKGETVWSIAQEYGMRKKKLLQKNRMKEGDFLEPGRKLWLKNTRPEDTPIEFDKSVLKEEPKVTKEEPKVIKTEPVQVTASVAVRVVDTTMYKVHKIVEGQTLYGISKMYNTTVDSLTAWNGGTTVKKDELMIVGRKGKNNVSAPATVTPVANEVVHTVAQGETLYSISKKYQVTTEQIKNWNNKQADSVSLGEQIRILK